MYRFLNFMKPTICLNMIVKNEAPVIQRCLATIKPWIDTWVISDTGSTDGTQELILDFMKDMPGQFIERPWIDFSYNRNEVLTLAKQVADFSVFIDADEQFIPSLDCFHFPTDKDCYFIKINEGASFHRRAFLLSHQKDIYWVGILHEGLYSDDTNLTEAVFSRGEILSKTEDGNRSVDPHKYLKDALILEEALKKNPNNSRYAFFLAQSYSNAKEYNLALNAYERRSQLTGSPDETFFSLFMIGALQSELKYDTKTCIDSFFKAHFYRPSRHEPLYGIGLEYMKTKRFHEAYEILNQAIKLPEIDDSIFFQTHMKEHLIPYLFMECCYYLGKYDQCRSVADSLLAKPDLPKSIKDIVCSNFSYINKKISD